MKKWIAVLMMVLAAATQRVQGQDVPGRGEFEPPARLSATPAPELVAVPKAADSDAQAPTLPPPMPPADPLSDSKDAGKPGMSAPAAAMKPVPPPPVIACDACLAKCRPSCCDKLKAWLCHHRENNPDCCYLITQPTAPLYTWFIDCPCLEGNITVPAVPTSCTCKQPCPLGHCFFGQILGNGNLSCH